MQQNSIKSKFNQVLINNTSLTRHLTWLKRIQTIEVKTNRTKILNILEQNNEVINNTA